MRWWLVFSAFISSIMLWRTCSSVMFSCTTAFASLFWKWNIACVLSLPTPSGSMPLQAGQLPPEHNARQPHGPVNTSTCVGGRNPAQSTAVDVGSTRETGLRIPVPRFTPDWSGVDPPLHSRLVGSRPVSTPAHAQTAANLHPRSECQFHDQIGQAVQRHLVAFEGL